MAWNVFGVGGIAPIFHNIAGVGASGVPPTEGISFALDDNLKTQLMLATNQLPQTGATAVGLLMNFDT